MRISRRQYRHKAYKGLTLIEVLTAAAVVAILVTITIGITTRIDSASKEKKTNATIEILVTALEQYYQFHKEFPLMEKNTPDDKIDVDDYYDYAPADFKKDIAEGLTVNIPTENKEEYLVNQALFFSLSRTPGSKKIVGKIDSSMITSEDDNNNKMFLTIDGRDYPLYRVTDAWKNLIRYTFDKENDSFPLIESAGPDKIFGDGSGSGDGEDEDFSQDNITNR